jgi:hypothetical protein
MAPASDEPSEIAEASGYDGLDQIQRQLVHPSSPYPKGGIEMPSSSTRPGILRFRWAEKKAEPCWEQHEILGKLHTQVATPGWLSDISAVGTFPGFHWRK